MGKRLLKNSRIENPQFETEILLSYLLNVDRYKLYTEKIEVSPRIYKTFLKLVKKRKKGISVFYLTKKISFYNCEFKIERGVFIPRPETELLVEKTIRIYQENFYPRKIKILDIGTGCGNIAISLAKNINKSIVKGVDISKKSLKIATENAILNKVKKRSKFFYSDIFSNINEKFEIIVSNPPYVNQKDYEKLDEEVKKEPKRAIYGGKDGLKIIKKIIKESPKFLKNCGFLIIEIGYDQSKKLKEFLPSDLKFLGFEKDLSGINRIAVFKKI
ncbi:MAG: peptide chain release factor N(5)-glutamine methyltransferase [Candidatus Omnitrophica bacterium]|nr:peptide chain release factor N(5)-glutamine methyltransferase [Candidatus Omnitrophota bacterium]